VIKRCSFCRIRREKLTSEEQFSGVNGQYCLSFGGWLMAGADLF
jgi:hypothetical protein